MYSGDTKAKIATVYSHQKGVRRTTLMYVIPAHDLMVITPGANLFEKAQGPIEKTALKCAIYDAINGTVQRDFLPPVSSLDQIGHNHPQNSLFLFSQQSPQVQDSFIVHHRPSFLLIF